MENDVFIEKYMISMTTLKYDDVIKKVALQKYRLGCCVGIFERFYVVPKSRKNSLTGSGLKTGGAFASQDYLMLKRLRVVL